ncbi:DUF6634 family protein [Dongia sp.]|uniref:DUF6634 family protein n=1 Tax=Dongia sp. TaxID=1977262 RepID=UPI0035B1A844
MTTIAIATTRGAELARLADVLAAFYGLLKKSTTYIDPMREAETSLFSRPPDTNEYLLAHVEITCSDPAQINREIAATIRDCQRLDGTIILSLPCYAQHLSADLLQLIDVFLIQATPAQASMTDAIRLLSEIQEHITSQKLAVRPWILGAGCAGGPAIAARLRASAALVLARDEHSSLRSEDLPILQWGMPLIHWSGWDHLSGLTPRSGKAPSEYFGRACNTLYRQVLLLAQHPDKAPTIDELAADSPSFFEPWLRHDTRGTAQRHLDLAEDLSLIEVGLGPIPEDFLNAPHLDEWAPTTRNFRALKGTVSDHPEQPTGDWIRTSEVVKFGPNKTWARTVSRFYTLGTPAEDEPGAPDTM